MKIIVNKNSISFKENKKTKTTYYEANDDNLISDLKIEILDNINLEIVYEENIDIKLDVEIIVRKNVEARVCHYYKVGKSKKIC